MTKTEKEEIAAGLIGTGDQIPIVDSLPVLGDGTGVGGPNTRCEFATNESPSCVCFPRWGWHEVWKFANINAHRGFLVFGVSIKKQNRTSRSSKDYPSSVKESRMDTKKEMHKDMSERDPNGGDRGDDYCNDVVGKNTNGNNTEERSNY
mmetsp:Transcript_46632/g.54499  ORF Transcript_46632/g.54499 Transcript_46632/m.54499 type:complete len:149 (+) Transcript_46632:282-728(+)|eukprot:CAMPEP_0194419876 /NCGR_PEP_ID=MMETSP0176-20130528/19088_1 /TAXON_ID=216777 /ORGANISM="Proboscia alata, Strain PI-D3" /LENGTH=148 /DNA_ID=CAMNT_0039227121 /DNA_START=562 /DNA_END=1008 /DNA_ORIENTATION=-